MGIFTLFLSVSLLFASGGQQGQNNAKTTLRFAWWGGDSRHQATLAAIDRYEQLNPNISIEPEYQAYDGYDAKIATQIAAGTLPDLVQLVQSKLVEFATGNDIFIDLSKQNILDYKLWDESFRRSFGNVDGKLLGLSTGVNSYNWFFNKDLMDRLNLPIPTGPITWDDLFNLGIKVNAADPNCYFMLGNNDDDNHIMRTYIRQKTGQWDIQNDYTILNDESAFLEYFTMLKKMYDQKYYQPVEDSYLYTNSSNPAWINGNIAACYCASSGFNAFMLPGMNFVPINIPQIPGSKYTGVITQPAQLFAVKKGPNSDEALKFFAWMYTTEEGALLIKDSRGTPPTQFQRDLLASKGLLDPVIANAVNMAVPISDEPIPDLSENSQVYNVVFDVIEQLTFNKITPEQAAKDIISRTQAVLDTMKKDAQQ